MAGPEVTPIESIQDIVDVVRDAIAALDRGDNENDLTIAELESILVFFKAPGFTVRALL